MLLLPVLLSLLLLLLLRRRRRRRRRLVLPLLLPLVHRLVHWLTRWRLRWRRRRRLGGGGRLLGRKQCIDMELLVSNLCLQAEDKGAHGGVKSGHVVLPG